MPPAPQGSLSGAITSEGGLIETPGLELLEDLGWQHANLMHELPGPPNPTGRARVPRADPARPPALRPRKLNSSLPAEALQQAELALTADRSAMLPVAANRDVYRLLRQGVPVDIRQPDGSVKPDRVALIDWTDPAANDFFVGSQVWFASELYKRRPDTIGFVNGIPLLLIEWKDPTQPVQDAYDDNLRDYRDTIPRLFDFNGFVILSNGLEALLGPSHAPFEFFAPWKRLDEDGPESVALETMLEATCEPTRFLDLIESFLLFEEARGGLRKVMAKYHQVLGVNRAIEAVEQLEENRGRLGVFWHTQGSGKSLSMVMFAEKVLRRLGGNWTFVIVTDRAGAGRADRRHLRRGRRAHQGYQPVPGAVPRPPARAAGGPGALRLHADPQVLGPSAASRCPCCRSAATSSSSPTRPTAASTTSSPPTCAARCRTRPSSASPARR